MKIPDLYAILLVIIMRRRFLIESSASVSPKVCTDSVFNPDKVFCILNLLGKLYPSRETRKHLLHLMGTTFEDTVCTMTIAV